MRIDVLTLFPNMFSAYLGESILQRAQAAGLLTLNIHNIRDYAEGKHRITDEPPFGGGGGMVLKPEPIFAAVEALAAEEIDRHPKVILLSPQGRLLSHSMATELAADPWLIFICGRYEGVDERVRDHLVDDEISIGDFVLTGGELAALVVIDALARHIPGVLGDELAAQKDSYADGLLEGSHYTRPVAFRDWQVPEVLRSGHAGHIARWRREQSIRRTWERRPELLLAADLSEADRLFLITLAREMVE